MQIKAFELRDRMTFIPMLGIDMNTDDGALSESYYAQRYLLRRCGYACDGQPNILFCRMDGSGKVTNDPYDWGDRTYQVAHNYVIDHWNELKDGDVIDVEFILGETKEKKKSEDANG